MQQLLFAPKFFSSLIISIPKGCSVSTKSSARNSNGLLKTFVKNLIHFWLHIFIDIHGQFFLKNRVNVLFTK
jgi:hypothetical protein